MPKVSVVIPLYNKGHCIRRALDSVVAQTRCDFEIIVIDDGSTDNGPEIVRSYRKHGVRMISQENAGPGAARNRGMTLATAHLITFLDADDELLPDFLKQMVGFHEANSECAAIVCGCQNGPSGLWTTKEWGLAGVSQGSWRLTPETSLHQFKSVWKLINTPALVGKRQLLEQYGGFYSKGRCTWGEDTYLTLQLMLNYPLYFVSEPLVWIHTEDSDLSVGRHIPRPLQPLLTDPDPVRMVCPMVYRNFLERLISLEAVLRARRDSWRGNVNVSKYLLRQYPRAKAFHFIYMETLIFLLCRPFVDILRRQTGLMRFWHRILTALGRA